MTAAKRRRAAQEYAMIPPSPDPWRSCREPVVLRKAWLPTVTPRESAVNIRSPHNTSDAVLLRGVGAGLGQRAGLGRHTACHGSQDNT